MLCAEPRFNFSSTRNVMAICNSPVATVVLHRTPILLLAALLIPTIIWTSEERTVPGTVLCSRDNQRTSEWQPFWHKGCGSFGLRADLGSAPP